MKIVARILLVIFLLAVPFLFYGFGRQTLFVISNVSFTDSRWLAFLLGAIVFVPCLFVAKRLFPSVWNYLETLEHELTHLIIGLLFLKIPVGIRVSAHAGGEVRQIGMGTTGDVWITLAPYFFPTVALAVLLIAYLFKIDALIALGALGWATAFHLISNWGETSFRQTDLQKAGILKTLLILPVMNLICYGSILAFVAGGRKAFAGFWIEGASASLKFARNLFFS